MLTDKDMQLMTDFNDVTLARFRFFTEIKVDSGRNRAMQTIWTSEDKRTQVTKTLVDFQTKTFYEVNQGPQGQLVCTRLKYGRVVMSIKKLLDLFWTPTKNLFVLFYGR
jgi:hypothetical protein